jgi:regulatory protein
VKIINSTDFQSSLKSEEVSKNGSKTITAIKAQLKNANRVSIFLDGTYSFSLTLDQLLEQKLKKANELEEVQVKALKKLSDEGKVRQRAIEWVLGRPHSTRELRDYLYRKKVEKDFMDQLVNDFTEKNYIDDRRFAEFFADNRKRKNKSIRAIKSELMSKGISTTVADQVLSNHETSNSDALKKLIDKISHRPRYQDEQKLKAYLVSKGFSYGEVKDALDAENSEE